MIDALKSVRDISRICEEEMHDSNHMRDITHLYLLNIQRTFILLINKACFGTPFKFKK